MRRLLSKRGQSTLEYAVLVVVIIGALIAMQVYVKRGVQGRLRESTDQIGEQFSPGYTESNKTTYSYVKSNEETTAFTTTSTIEQQYQCQTVDEKVQNAGSEYWSAATSETT